MPHPDFRDSVDEANPVQIDYTANPWWKPRDLCWEMKGPMWSDFKNVLKPSIDKELHGSPRLIGRVPSVWPYMLGRSLRHAKPVIVIASKYQDCREEAKNAIERSGLLEGYEHFKLWLLKHLPEGQIRANAMGDEAFSQTWPPDSSDFDIYFNPTRSLRVTSMPIYIAHGNSLRRATANAVCKATAYAYCTAAHAFLATPNYTEPESDTEEIFEMPFQSDSGSDDELDAEIRSEHSRTSSEPPQSESPTPESNETSRSDSQLPSQFMNPLVEISEQHTGQEMNDHTNPRRVNGDFLIGNDRLERLGRVSMLSAPLDYAIISVTHPAVVKFLQKLTPDQYKVIAVKEAMRAEVIALTSRGQVPGRLFDVPLYMDYTNIGNQSLVYKLRYDGVIQMGDCGSLVIDKESEEVYGHIVANSESTHVAFLVSAVPIVEHSSNWKFLSPVLSSLEHDTVSTVEPAPVSILEPAPVSIHVDPETSLQIPDKGNFGTFAASVDERGSSASGGMNLTAHAEIRSIKTESGATQVPRSGKRKVLTTPIQVKRTRISDEKPKETTRENVQQTLRRAASRLGQLNKFGLLYEYKPIKNSEIRLLRILRARKYDDDIHVTLETVADQDTGSLGQEYEALSYDWGEGPADRPIYLPNTRPMPIPTFTDLGTLSMTIPDYQKEARIYVRPNLEKALRQLRSFTEDIVMWVDALCINQSDQQEEKPAQVMKMVQIFNRARNVCIWLGEGTRHDHEGMENWFNAVISSVIRLEKSGMYKEVLKEPGNILDMCGSSWFSRRWAVQELAAAREATIHWGSRVIPWRDFADVIGIFDMELDKNNRIERLTYERKLLGAKLLGAKLLVDVVTNVFRRSNAILEPVWTLEELVYQLTHAGSSDPRDAIFALLNISRESLLQNASPGSHITPPRVMYNKELLEVYTEFLEWVVYSTKSLDIICRKWAIGNSRSMDRRRILSGSPKLPTWIQEIPRVDGGNQGVERHGRDSMNSLVGQPGRQRYNASYSTELNVQFGKRPSIPVPYEMVPPKRSNSAPPGTAEGPPPTGTKNLDGRLASQILRVQGVQLDTVTWVVAPAAAGIIDKSCLEKAGWQYPENEFSQETLPDKLWRTLVADRTPEGSNPPTWYHRAALHCMKEVIKNPYGSLNIGEIISAEKDPPRPVVEYVKRVQAVTSDRAFIAGSTKRSDSEPLFGLASRDTKLNDRICILFGCSVPCILRPYVSSNGTEYFEFVGEAYIYGIMEGEAVATLGKDELKAQTRVFQVV
ncbi:hypothetical protein K491DRAFT_678121 [Lophiostoma macrostomum CBS 122681]|uniref:Heterokaryon incompatibility domain-containing protein n=1 Tax=Lophiostoma macrostomum CBS 122681 TaxID=1314788 RepID=A0A6A6T8U9_9PLEO|nr:hypothetical protein K491DRAFT_678121 [Lophiostoma macrostomum CBS 122681]